MQIIPRVQHLRPTEDHAAFNLDVSQVIEEILQVIFHTDCLTITQAQVMLQVLCGKSDAEIAADFGCSFQNITKLRKTAWERLQKRLPDILLDYKDIGWHAYRAGRPRKDAP